MEDVLRKLLVADNAVIQQATQELREAFKNQDSIKALCVVLATCNDAQIRQYAVVLLRKRFSKARHWNKLSAELRAGIKQGTLQTLSNEPERFVRNSICQFVGTLAKHELATEFGWPEMLNYLQQAILSQNPPEREMGMNMLSIVSEGAAEQLIPHVVTFATLFGNTLQETQTDTAYYTVLTMLNFITYIGTDHVKVFQPLIPMVISVIRHLLTTDEEKAGRAMEIFGELVDSEVSTIVPHLRPTLELCLEVAGSSQLGTGVRARAMEFLCTLTRHKRKAVVKLGVVGTILDVIFPIMCSPVDDDDQDGDSLIGAGDEDSCTPHHSAAQTLDILALHLPPDKLIPPLLLHVEPALKSENPFERKAGYVSLAVLAEGCSEYIRTRYLQSFLQCVCTGIRDPQPLVRNSALFALGQFAEFLQPEATQFSAELLPLLLEYLAQLCEQVERGSGKEPASANRIFYALEMFCENLEDGLLPYLPALMDRLFAMQGPKYSVKVKELTMSAMGAAADAVKEAIMPYFPRIMEQLKVYLTQPQEEETMCLQVQALDTLGVLARSVGQGNFAPLAAECIVLGLNLIDNKDDPDLRKSAYGLFASVATVLQEEMAPFLPRIVTVVMAAVKSTDGVVLHYKDEDDEGAAGFSLTDDLSDEEEEDILESENGDEDDDEDVTGFSVENAYVLEKEEACLVLKELASHSGPAFWQYLPECFQELLKLVSYPQEDIRKSSIEALAQVLVSTHQVGTPEALGMLGTQLTIFVPKMAEVVHVDEERPVVMAALDAYAEVLKGAGRMVLHGEGHLPAIINCVKDVMRNKTECQDLAEDQDGDLDEEQAEHDEMLMQYAGEIVPHLGKAMGTEQFAPCFSELLPIFVAKTKKQCSTSDKSFSVGALAESLEPLGPAIANFTDRLLPVFYNAIKDEDVDVRNNGVYGIGELVFHGKEAIYSEYSNILQILSKCLHKEKSPRVMDNICGAVAKVLLSNSALVPVDQVLPVLLQNMPLKEDFEENKPVFFCLSYLYELGHPTLREHLKDVLGAAAVALTKQKPVDETLKMIEGLLKNSAKDFPEEFQNFLNGLPAEMVDKVKQLL